MRITATLGLLLLLLQRGFSCVISGTDSGTCSKRYLPSSYGDDVQAIDTARSLWDCEGPDCLPFCGNYVASYPLCLPKSGVSLPPDQNFPNGRFQNHTTGTYHKDNWVKQKALETIANKPHLFAANLDCQEAYKPYICYVNFPRCDENELSLPVCSSVCENFMRACGMDKELRRSFCEAGDHPRPSAAAAVTRGDKGEELPPVTTAFPGQPFVENKWKGRGQPDIVCTPSVKSGGFAEKGAPMWWLVVSFLVAGLCCGVV